MMNLGWLATALIAGVLLGTFYFGGLWLTVRRMPTARSPALLFFASFLVRTAVVVLGIYLIMNGSWEPAVACAAGFLLARTVICRSLRTHASNQTTPPLSARRPAS